MVQRIQKISDDGSLHPYRTEIPNTVVRGVMGRNLSIHAKWLYVYLKSVCGDNGMCYRSTRTIADESGLSSTMVISAKKELIRAELISVEPNKNPRRNTDHLHIKDIWLRNMQEFSVPIANTDSCEDYEEPQKEDDASVPIANTDSGECSISEHQCSISEQSVLLANAILRRSHEEDPMKKEEPPSVTTDVVTSSPRQRPLTPERLVAMYHESIPPGHPKVTVLSPERKKHAAAYLRTFPDESFWRAVFGEIWHSPFLRGEKASPGHRPVKRGFDWFLQKGKDDGLENCVKTFEGRYRDSPEDHRRECLSPSEYRSTLAGDRFVERGYEETRRSESFSDGDDAVIDGIQYRIE